MYTFPRKFIERGHLIVLVLGGRIKTPQLYNNILQHLFLCKNCPFPGSFSWDLRWTDHCRPHWMPWMVLGGSSLCKMLSRIHACADNESEAFQNKRTSLATWHCTKTGWWWVHLSIILLASSMERFKGVIIRTNWQLKMKPIENLLIFF